MSLCWGGTNHRPTICRPANAKQTGTNIYSAKHIVIRRAISQAILQAPTPVDIANKKLEFANMMRMLRGDASE